MPRFFITKEQIDENQIRITGEDAHHIARALRMATGEQIVACDSEGVEYTCVITDFEEDERVTARIISREESKNEPVCKIALYQALPKGDKLDMIIQKAVECGVGAIYPFESERCIVKQKPEAEQRKTERRQRIAEEAAKQCGRSKIPTVSATVSFSQMLDSSAMHDVCLFCYEGGGTLPLGRVLEEQLRKKENGEYPTAAIVIGSEGGFSEKEAEEAVRRGMIPVCLGSRILRTETASGFVLSCIICKTELM